MTRDEKIYFSLLRIGLGTESPREILPELAKLQWGELYRLAVRQGTGALIWDALRQLHATEYLPLSLRVQWAYNVKQIEDRYRKQEKVLAELSKFYASFHFADALERVWTELLLSVPRTSGMWRYRYLAFWSTA